MCIQHGRLSPFVQIIGSATSTKGALSRLNYYGYRYYDPLSLTWTQADPLFRLVSDLAYEQPRLMSLYAFSLNNPIRYVDPDGRWPTLGEIGGGLKAAGGAVGSFVKRNAVNAAKGAYVGAQRRATSMYTALRSGQSVQHAVLSTGASEAVISAEGLGQTAAVATIAIQTGDTSTLKDLGFTGLVGAVGSDLTKGPYAMWSHDQAGKQGNHSTQESWQANRHSHIPC